MSTSDRHTFPLEIEVDPPAIGPGGDARIVGYDMVRAQGFGSLRAHLPKGIYVVRVECAGTVKEEFRVHEGPGVLGIPEPPRYSAVPATDAANSSPDYQSAAVEWSRTPTALIGSAKDGRRAAGSLFIFLRSPAAHGSEPIDATGRRS
jgi:hypothetical protein